MSNRFMAQYQISYIWKEMVCSTAGCEFGNYWKKKILLLFVSRFFVMIYVLVFEHIIIKFIKNYFLINTIQINYQK